MDKYGDWTIIKADDKKPLCRCVCGTEREVLIGNLRAGRSTSCGCQGRLRIGKKMKAYWSVGRDHYGNIKPTARR